MGIEIVADPDYVLSNSRVFGHDRRPAARKANQAGKYEERADGRHAGQVDGFAPGAGGL